MIIDSHCHAWTRWPYSPPVPDDTSRGRVEQLLHEMDLFGVGEAVVICAQIDHNPDNNRYVAEQAERYSHRLHPFPDVDSSWSSTYHQTGAAERLTTIIKRFPHIKGFTHYLKADEDAAWLYGPDGLAFFKVATEHNLIASIACYPRHQAALRKVAVQFPTLPILCHHLSGLRVRDPALGEVLASAKLPNLYIKLSGFAYCSRVNWEYPYDDTHDTIRALYEHFGPIRMCWGSDYPVVRFYMTYKQSLEAFRTHCTFVSEADKGRILGANLSALLAGSGNR